MERCLIVTDNRCRDQVAALLGHLRGAYAPNTLRAYRADALELIAHCESSGECALPASPDTVAGFLMQTLTRGIKSSTIRRKISSISAIHRLSCLDDPTKHPEVKISQRKIFRELGTRFEQAYPITRVLLEKLVGQCGGDLYGIRNRALLLVAYDSMRRRSELVSLRVEDVEWLSNGGAAILLRRSKTDQHGCGKWIHLSNETGGALKNWLNTANIKSGFVFRGIRSSNTLTESLCDSRIGRIYKSLALKANIDQVTVRRISGHSMRVGAAQDLLTLGASLPQMMIKGGWAKADTVIRYTERVHPTQG
jgi:site-specific recombinase XerD